MTLDMKQYLCPRGEQLRIEFMALHCMPENRPAQYKVIQRYFQHKWRCVECDLDWLPAQQKPAG